jgi:hypothetical protein
METNLQKGFSERYKKSPELSRGKKWLQEIKKWLLYPSKVDNPFATT